MLEAYYIHLCAHATCYMWCSLFHRKHHKWAGNYRRDCAKCKSWYVWPDRVEVIQRSVAVEIERKGFTTPLLSLDEMLERQRLMMNTVPFSLPENQQQADDWPEVIDD